MEIEQDQELQEGPHVKNQVIQIQKFITQVYLAYADVLREQGHLQPMKEEETRQIQTKLQDFQRLYDCGQANNLNHFESIERTLLGVFEEIITFITTDSTIQQIINETRIIRNLIYYLRDPFQIIKWGLSQKAMQHHTGGDIRLKDYTEKCMEIVVNNYVNTRLVEFALLYQQMVIEMRINGRQMDQGAKSLVMDFGEVIIFFQMTQYPGQYSVVRHSHKFLDLKWKSPSKKSTNYVKYFESPFLSDMVIYYNKSIDTQFDVLEYSDLIKWLGQSLVFEMWLVDHTLKNSSKELEINLKEILKFYIERLTSHPQGPLFMLKNRLYDQLEQLLSIVSLEVYNVILVANMFGDFLIETMIQQFQGLPQQNINLSDAQRIFTEADKILTLADTICQRFADPTLDMFNKDVCRAEFFNNKQRAFEYLLRFNSNLVDSIHILIDNHIRQGLQYEEIIWKMRYFVSVYEKREQFFTKYGEMLSFRLLDNFRKFYPAEQQIIQEFKKTVQNEQLIYLQKVLDDVELSVMVSESINQNQQFEIQVKPFIKKVNLLIISEIQISSKTNKQCSWFLPQKALEELVVRRREYVSNLEKNKLFQVQNQAIEDQRKQMADAAEEEKQQQQAVVKKKKEVKSKKKRQTEQVQVQGVQAMDIEKGQKPERDELIMSSKSPQCLYDLFELSSSLLKQYKDHRFLTHPLLSLGVAEVVFKIKSGDYFLQMSTPQMVLALMIDDRPSKKLKIKHLRTVLMVESLEDDVMALCKLGVLLRNEDVLSVNINFSSKDKKIKTRPQIQNLLSPEQQLAEKVQEKQNQQVIIKTFIVKTLKREKRVLIKQLVELINYQAQQIFVSSRERVNLIVQQLIIEQVYIQLDQNDALYVTYLP